MGVRDSGADKRHLPFTSRLRQSCRKKNQPQERERFIQGHRLMFGEESSYEKSSGNPPLKWEQSTVSVTSHQMPWREGKTRYPTPPLSWQFTSMVPLSVQDVPDVDGLFLACHLGNWVSETYVPRPGRGRISDLSVLSVPTLPFHLTNCHIAMGSSCQAGYHVRRFSQKA